MTAANVVNEYVAIINKLEELRLLLKKKLIQLKAIDSSGLIDGENVTFPKLLTKVNPTDIGSAINKQLPNQPVDLTDDFVTDFKINGSFNSQYSIEDFNSLLIDKFNFYREYLMYQLENMGVSKNEINQAITIKNLILLLDKVDKIKTINNITCDDTTIYVNQNNILEIYIYDEIGTEVKKGTLEIYENGTCIYSENIGEEVIITPTTIGEHTYNFKYVNKDKNTNTTIDKYITSELFPITIDVIYPPLEGSFTLQNITTTSKYYTGNEDDFIGYENDKWDINVNIFDINQNSINQTIPFDIYMYDDQHLVTSGVTDATGHIKLTNVTIPYTNFDFIDFRESAITHFSIDTELDESTNVSETIDIDELSFIKDPTLVDGNLTYRRVLYNKNNYLDDLNGCITNIELIDNKLRYTTFSTTNHTKIEEIDDLTNIIGHFVTEIFYANDIVTYETITDKKYIYDKQEPDHIVFLILKTKLDDPEYPNAELYHNITVYDNPLKIDDNYLTWYKSDPDIPSSIPIVLYDEKTNEPLQYLDQEYIITVNGESDTMTSPTYNYNININDLPYGDTNLNVTLSISDTELASLHKTITVLSNFELPSKTIYYANNTPDIYYKPKGNIAQNKQVKVNSTTYYTNANGLLHAIKDNKTIGNYTLTLVAASDGLSEERNFSYELKKPFTINRTSYDQYSQIVYAITFYDKEYVGWGSTQGVSSIPNPENFINITNKNNENINYTYTSNFTDNSITYYVTVNKVTNTVGINTLTVEINGYSETDTFEFFLYEHLYELITTEIELGINKIIQVRCNDPDVSTINISGEGIVINTIEKNNDIFSINCNIQKAAPNGTTISMTDGSVTETSTLVISKGTMSGSLFIAPTTSDTHITSFPSGQSTDMQLYYSLTLSSPAFSNIQFIVNDGISNYNQSLTDQTTERIASIVNFKNTNRIPGTYTATLTFNGNDNFNAYTTSLTYTITADGALTLTPLSDFLDGSHTSTTLIATYINGNNQPISGATIDITTTDVVVGTTPTSIVMYDKKTTDSNGIATFTVNSVGLWKAYHKVDNTIYAVSNESNIRGVVEESSTHISDNIILESDKNILSYADNETTTLTATIYDQHGDKIKNKVVKFYIVNSKKYSVSLKNVEVL